MGEWLSVFEQRSNALSQAGAPMRISLKSFSTKIEHAHSVLLL